ncbi:unnamed protein product [Sympodiomycopsis kandeliae]
MTGKRKQIPKENTNDENGVAKRTRSSAQQQKPSDTSSTATKTTAKTPEKKYPVTPDGHYFIVRGKCWRCTNPNLANDRRAQLQKELMNARRLLTKKNQEKSTREEIQAQRDRVQKCKEELGERGEPWWDVTSQHPVVDRKMVRNTVYKDWWDQLEK